MPASPFNRIPRRCCRAMLLVAVMLWSSPRAALGQDVESSVLNLMTRSITQFPCTRLINMTGDVGCSSGSSGVTGFLYLVETEADLSGLINLGSSSVLRTAVLAPSLAIVPVDAVRELAKLPWLAGIIMLPALPADGFSPEVKKLPRGFLPGWAWNTQGQGLLAERFRFPIIAVQQPEADAMVALAQYNRAQSGYTVFPQHAVHMFYYMGPDAMTSVSCLDSQSCLPLGGQSVWGSMGPLDAAPPPPQPVAAGQQTQQQPTPGPQRPIVMAVCPLDSSAMFHGLAFGADSAASSIVATLAAADALSRTNVSALPRQVMFALFQAEQWGRIGSRRWLAEVERFACQANVSAVDSPNGRPYCAQPLRSDVAFASLNLRDFAFVLAVDQVGRRGLDTLYVHEFDARQTPTNATFYTLEATLAGSGLDPGFSVKQAGTTAAPPPTSLLSWQDRDTPLAIDGAVLSEYDTAFQSRYYHSEFDNAAIVDAGSVAAAATVIARGLYALATALGDPAAAAAAVPGDLRANTSLVSELLDCITVQAQCPLFAALLGVDAPGLAGLVPAGPLSLYTGVYNQPYTLAGGGYVLQSSPIEAIARNLLAFSSSLPSQRNGSCGSSGDCASRTGSKAYECILGTCIIANAFYHDALSPALAVPSGDGSTAAQFAVNSDLVTGEDVLWTEPYWSSNIGATVFLKDSGGVEAGVLSAGVFTTVAAVAGAWFLVRFLDEHYRVP